MSVRENARKSLAFGIRGVMVGAAGGVAYQIFSSPTPSCFDFAAFAIFALAAALLDFSIREFWEVDL